MNYSLIFESLIKRKLRTGHGDENGHHNQNAGPDDVPGSERLVHTVVEQLHLRTHSHRIIQPGRTSHRIVHLGSGFVRAATQVATDAAEGVGSTGVGGGHRGPGGTVRERAAAQR
eukprot:1195987-Prorocentrum_minimum.AAC.4